MIDIAGKVCPVPHKPINIFPSGAYQAQRRRTEHRCIYANFTRKMSGSEELLQKHHPAQFASFDAAIAVMPIARNISSSVCRRYAGGGPPPIPSSVESLHHTFILASFSQSESTHSIMAPILERKSSGSMSVQTENCRTSPSAPVTCTLMHHGSGFRFWLRAIAKGKINL